MAKIYDGSPDKVREICRHLKPMLGDKADQLFHAYLAEDDPGRQQIETYLELLQTKYLLAGLDDNSQVLIPPSPEQAQGEYEIAPIIYGNTQTGTFGLREGEWIQHVGIFGRTGAGKTNLGFQILRQLVRRGKPVLIFDWKRNYRDLLANPLFKDTEVYTIGRDIRPFTFNPFIRLAEDVTIEVAAFEVGRRRFGHSFRRHHVAERQGISYRFPQAML